MQSIWLLAVFWLLALARIEVPLHKLNQRLAVFPLKNSDLLKYGLGEVQHFYGVLSFGTPPQVFNVTFDTFSKNSWLVTDLCNSCNFSKKFLQKESSTYESTTIKSNTHVYNMHTEGEVTGLLSSDYVTFKSNVTFRHAFSSILADNSMFSDPGYSGSISLSLATISKKNSENFVHSLYTHKLIETYTFGISFDKTARGYEPIITFGGLDKRYADYKSLDWINVENPSLSYWNVPLTNITLGNYTLIAPDTVKRAAITLSDPFFHFPEAIFNQILEVLEKEGLNCSVRDKGYIICETPSRHYSDFPDLQVFVEGFTFALSSTDYVYYGEYQGRLVAALGIFPSKDPSYVVLGTNALWSYYTVFDCQNLRIGIMRLKEIYHTWALVVIGIIIAVYAIYSITIDRKDIYGSSDTDTVGGD